MAQLVEHILGKDEVPGSNPGISLKRRRSVERLNGIFICMGKRAVCGMADRFFVHILLNEPVLDRRVLCML